MRTNARHDDGGRRERVDAGRLMVVSALPLQPSTEPHKCAPSQENFLLRMKLASVASTLTPPSASTLFLIDWSRGHQPIKPD